MTIRDIILDIDELSEDVFIYAKKLDGKFDGASEAVLLELSDDDLELQTKDVSGKYCPGVDYFLEASIVK